MFTLIKNCFLNNEMKWMISYICKHIMSKKYSDFKHANAHTQYFSLHAKRPAHLNFIMLHVEKQILKGNWQSCHLQVFGIKIRKSEIPRYNNNEVWQARPRRCVAQRCPALAKHTPVNTPVPRYIFRTV